MFYQELRLNISTRRPLLRHTPQSPPDVEPEERVRPHGGLVQDEEEGRVDDGAAQ